MSRRAEGEMRNGALRDKLRETKRQEKQKEPKKAKWEGLKKRWEGYVGIAAATAAMLFLLSIEGTAAENGASSSGGVSGNDAASTVSSGDESGDGADDSATSDTGKETDSENDAKHILAVAFPIVEKGEASPFDFILDPYGLLYETAAVRYGGGRVEKGATMLFCNEEGEDDFSRYSDKLSIINHGEESVIVSVSASVSDMGEIELVGDGVFSGKESPAVYLALTDDRGNEHPIPEGGEAWIRIELGSGAYSFGLVGACNPRADWKEVNVHPKVTVTWYVEPAMEKGKEEGETAE